MEAPAYGVASVDAGANANLRWWAGASSSTDEANVPHGKISSAKQRAVYRRDGMVCYLCGQTVVWQLGLPNTATIDHVVPFVYGGRSTEDNLKVCCHRCNMAKGQRTPEEFRIGEPKSVERRLVEALAKANGRDAALPLRATLLELAPWSRWALGPPDKDEP